MTTSADRIAGGPFPKPSLADASRDELLRYIESLEQRALHDPLTGLPNRALLDDRLGQVVAASNRRGVPFAYLVCDLDQFKAINDRFGHQVGDDVLREVARRLRETVRDSDTVARLGGDEFAILLPDTNSTGAKFVAQKVRQSLDAPIVVDGARLHVYASVGVSVFPDGGADATAVVSRADDSMYRAKGTRRFVRVRQVQQVLGAAAAVVFIAVLLTDYGGLQVPEASVKPDTEPRVAAPAEVESDRSDFGPLFAGFAPREDVELASAVSPPGRDDDGGPSPVFGPSTPAGGRPKPGNPDGGGGSGGNGGDDGSGGGGGDNGSGSGGGDNGSGGGGSSGGSSGGGSDDGGSQGHGRNGGSGGGHAGNGGGHGGGGGSSHGGHHGRSRSR